jgi:hypothetical protein
MPPITLPPPAAPIVPKTSGSPLPTAFMAGASPPSSATSAGAARRTNTSGANDPILAMLGLSAKESFTAAQKHVAAVQEMKFDGTPEANVKAAMGAVSALTETSLLLQQGHRKLDDVVPLSKEMSANLMLGATQAASVGPSLIAAVGSGKATQVTGKLAQLLSSISTVIGAAIEVSDRAATAQRNPTPNGYL